MIWRLPQMSLYLKKKTDRLDHVWYRDIMTYDDIHEPIFCNILRLLVVKENVAFSKLFIEQDTKRQPTEYLL